MTTDWTLAIDFGTTSTVAAVGGPGRQAEVLEIDGQRTMPSVVVVADNGSLVVGEAAAGLARANPARTVRTPKNRLGDPVPIVVGGQPHQPVTFVAAILEHVLRDAIRHQDSAPSRCRLTYPATWNRPKRSRLLEAATKAGLPDPELVAEPIAAALSYADSALLNIGDHVAVYDLGGGTFDTVVLLRTQTGFTVVGRPLGDAQLGGELFDEILMNHVGEQIDPHHWEQLLVSDDPQWTRSAARLRAECRRAKESLSVHPVAEVTAGLPSGIVEVAITRQLLDSLIGPYVDESIDLLKQCVSDAGQTGESVKAIYMTGGGSRMPLVEERLRLALPNTPISRRGNPKLAVALGALLAVPGSLDRSLAQSPERTTVEGVDEAAAPAPIAQAAPTYDPAGPTEVAPPGQALRPPPPRSIAPPPVVPATPPPVVPATPPPVAAASVAPEPHTQIAAPMSAVVPAPEPAPVPATSGKRSLPGRALAGAGLLAAAVAGAVVLFLTLGDRNTEDPTDIRTVSDSTTTSTEVDDSTEPTASISEVTTTTTVAESTTTTSEVPTTTTTVATDVPTDGPGQAELLSAAVGLADLPTGWSPVPYEGDQIDLCGLPLPPDEILRENLAFARDADLNQFVSVVLLYEDVAGAEALIDYDQAVTDSCSGTSVDFAGVGEFDVTVIDQSITVPDGGDEAATLALLFSEDVIGIEIYQVGAEVRVGRIVTSVAMVTTGPISEADLALLEEMLQLTVDRVANIPQ